MAVPTEFKQNSSLLVQEDLIFRSKDAPAIDITGGTLETPDIEVVKRVGKGAFYGALVVNIESFVSISAMTVALYGVDLDSDGNVLSQNALGSTQIGGPVDPLTTEVGTHIWPVLLNALNGRLFDGVKFAVSGTASSVKFNAFFGKRMKP